MQFGSAGPGTTTHLGCALLNSVIGVNVTHLRRPIDVTSRGGHCCHLGHLEALRWTSSLNPPEARSPQLGLPISRLHPRQSWQGFPAACARARSPVTAMSFIRFLVAGVSIAWLVAS